MSMLSNYAVLQYFLLPRDGNRKTARLACRKIGLGSLQWHSDLLVAACPVFMACWKLTLA